MSRQDIKYKEYPLIENSYKTFLSKLYREKISDVGIKKILIDFCFPEDQIDIFINARDLWFSEFLQNHWENFTYYLQEKFSRKEIRVLFLVEGLEDGTRYSPRDIAVKKMALPYIEIYDIKKMFSELMEHSVFDSLLKETILQPYFYTDQNKNDIDEVIRNLACYDFKAAEELFNRRFTDHKPVFDFLKSRYWETYKHTFLAGSVEHSLAAFEFIQADLNNKQYDIYPSDEYDHKKAAHITNYFRTKLLAELLDEQAYSIAADKKNILVQARAGSGKTTVLSCKTVLLIDRYQVNPDHILILAFNKKAAQEIGNRIRRRYGFESFENARTFHGLAYQLVRPNGKILFNEKGEFVKQEFSNFIQSILREILTESDKHRLYEFFRKEMSSAVNVGAFLSSADYVAFVRNQRDITLGGDRVKSSGEKFIADFLFEHGIKYLYEAIEYASGQNYRPDFRIITSEHNLAIEFWGIDENDPNREVPKTWDISWKEYQAEMVWKRDYWKDKGIPLIEFSIVDLRGGRDNFEKVVKSRLDQVGLRCVKLPQEVLEESVERIHSDRLSRLFVQFIQKARKCMWSATEIQQKVNEFSSKDHRVQIFLNIASQVYTAFEKKLHSENLVDFDELIVRAADIIEKTKGECSLALGQKKERHIKIKDIQWILIDEFQDFSQLFYHLICTMQKYNPNVRLMSVGDDWQAINGFAGSDLRYFEQFDRFMLQASRIHLLTNHRSQKAIVACGNSLMNNRGEPGMWRPENNGGNVSIKQIDKTWIEQREGDEYQADREADKRFRFLEKRENGVKENDNGRLQAKYLKACYEIIKDVENWNLITEARRKDDRPRLAILCRRTSFFRVTLNEFYKQLKLCFSTEELRKIGDFQYKLRISTVHGFKGIEADIVIIIGACEGSFPLIHPDSSLFEMFGQTEQDILDEERRLFYVAITRSAKKLYFLTEEGHESPYLSEITRGRSIN